MNSSIRTLAFGAFLSIPLGGSAIAEVVVQRIPLDSGPPILLLKGRFTSSDDPQVLAREVAASGAKVVTFDSPGGNIVSAMAFGRLIRSLGLSTFQLRAAECASACTLTFVGGTTRQAEPGAIGVHQSSFSSDANLNSHDAVTAVQSMTADIMTYLIEMGVDPKLLQLSLSVPSDDMRYLTASEMRGFRVTSGSTEDLSGRLATAMPSPSKLPEAYSPPEKKTVVPDTAPMTTEQKALAFAVAYHDAWSSGNATALQFMERAYGSVVEFYGKPIPKADVVEDKRKFARRWPTRAYSLKHGSERASCATTCQITGVVEWYAKRDFEDRTSSGAAQFTMTWDPTTATITSETGKVLETDQGATRPLRLLSQWHRENTTCRGSSGNSPETMAACDRRESIYGKLKSVGWCYGREGEYGYQMDWHVCDEAQSRSATVAAAVAAGSKRPRPTEYPSRARMSGKTVLPNFKARDRDFNSFRTRIRDGMQKGPNFAGYFTVIQFGCGTGCSGVVVGDNRTGRPIRFPRGGEDNMYLALEFRLDSRLMAAQWLDYDASRCFIEFFDFDRGAWNVVSKISVGSTDACYRSIGENLQ
ncbi:hypothetical protein [Pararhizobium gei]|uniref:COG3904 family protein n=1 Tax=Pararhizobium gei TaxID=1395951 RepID=UPI0023DC495C|nr:hypothetical protein [Rhizobium gei]